MIIDLQRRISEVGRIRIGQQVTSPNGKSRPAKLDTFRLTTPDRRRIAEAAKLYGGTPQEWAAPAGRQWELVTEVDHLNVIVPPSDMAFSQFYELWSAGGCQRRCDGQNESISDGPCRCDPDNRECSIHTRLSIMLRDLPGLGVWRLDTQGYYAAVELQGAVEIVRLAAGRGDMLPAVLRLEQRMVKREGQTRRFAVPVLDIEVSPAQLLAGHTPPGSGVELTGQPQALPGAPNYAQPNLTPVPETVPEWPQASVAEQALTAPKPRRRSAAPIPKTGVKPRTRQQATAVVEEPPPPDEPPDDIGEQQTIDNLTAADQVSHAPPEQPQDLITPAQLKKLAIVLREAGFETRETRHGFCATVIGRDITSSKDLTKTEASDLIERLELKEPPEQP